MKATREEAVKVLDKEISKRKTHNLVLLEQAAVDKQKLLNDPRWDVYLQEIQKFLNDSEANLKSLREQYESPELVDPLEKERIKNALLMNVQDIATLNRVKDLPKQVIEDGNKAKGFMSIFK